jgi:hypothetical protein
MATTQKFSPPLRPLGVGEVLDASFKVVRQSFKTLVICVLVVALPLNILTTLITASTSDNPFNLDSFDATSAGAGVSSGTEAAGALLTTLLSLVLTTLAAAACYRAVSAAYLGENPTWQESLRFAAERLGPLVWLSILYVIALIIPFILLVLPGIWLAIAWSLSYPVLLHEGLGGQKALGRSFKLVRGRWWPTFLALLVMYLIVIVISGILGVILGAALISGLDNEALAAVVYTLVNTASSLVTLPLVAAVVTIIYFDLRVRKEGFDLQMLAQGVGQTAARPASSGYGETSPDAVGESSGLGGTPPASSPPSSGGFAPPQAPQQPPSAPEPAPPADTAGSSPPPSAPPPPASPSPAASPPGPPEGGLQSGDPLAPPPRREDDGGSTT